MATIYAKGPNCRVFQDGEEKIMVHSNPNGTIQIVLMSALFERNPFLIIPKSLCKEVGLEIYELGCRRGAK